VGSFGGFLVSEFEAVNRLQTESIKCPGRIDEVIRIEKGGWKNYFVQTPVIEAFILKPSSESGKRKPIYAITKF
jgi:hypothetical protein